MWNNKQHGNIYDIEYINHTISEPSASFVYDHALSLDKKKKKEL